MEVEILPPSPELVKSVDRIYEKYKDAFEERNDLAIESVNYVNRIGRIRF